MSHLVLSVYLGAYVSFAKFGYNLISFVLPIALNPKYLEATASLTHHSVCRPRHLSTY